ncbi:MAG: peptidoglycan-associated lipoprotein Pal, partial [Nitrospirae bacterium]
PNGMKELRMTDGTSFRLVSGDHPGSAVDAARRERLAAMEASLADVYFEYDRSSVRKGDRPMLERNAQFLKSEQDWQLLISGHCDERGSESYNLVLGERRARSVQRYLVDLGIPSSQMQIVSYGKEKPFCGEHDTNCWQQNRRAHFAMQ